MITLYGFQQKILEKTSNYNNVLYALEMGLGKTFVGSEKMRIYGNRINLVICQKSKVDDWFEHLSENYDDYNIYNLTRRSNDIELFIADMLGNLQGKYIGIINYDLIFRRPELLKLRNITLILDESSLIQNERSKRAKFVLKMKKQGCIKNAILLSGTVINGNYEKLWSQCELLGWSIKKGMFLSQYVRMIKRNINGIWVPIILGYKNVERLKEKLRNYGAVFMKSEEVLELPEQTFIYLTCENIPEYKKFDKNKVIEINGKKLSADFKLTERIIKRYICGLAKLKRVEDLIDSTDDRLIIFYNYNEELDNLVKIVNKKERPISYMNGDKKDLKAYEQEDNSITFVQFQSGSMGLNLQMANKIIYFSLPDGGAEMFDQSIKRIHRIGQDKPCFYYILMVKDSIEQDIIAVLKRKSKRINNFFK